MCYTLKLLWIAPAWGVLNRCGVHFCFRSVSPFTTWCQKWDSNWQLIKLQLTCEDHALLWFYIGSSKEIIFFLIHSLNLRKKENRCFDNILFVNYSSVITKYPFLTLSCVLKVGRARWECLFWAFIVWRKARLQKTWSCVRGKKSMKGEFKWDFERLKWDFCWIAKLLYLSF